MRKKTVLPVAMMSISVFLVLGLRNAWSAELKVGDEAPGFILSSTLDKEVAYYRDYYGKHHLILTFIANAFGPNCTDDSVGHQKRWRLPIKRGLKWLFKSIIRIPWRTV
jgi:hypothetical protein